LEKTRQKLATCIL